MYDASQIRYLETNPEALAVLPTVEEAIQLARFDLDKDSRALSFQYLAVTLQASLVLLQVGRVEQRVLWNFGHIILKAEAIAAAQAFDDPDQ